MMDYLLLKRQIGINCSIYPAFVCTLYGIGFAKSKDRNPVTLFHCLSVNGRDVTSHGDISNALADNIFHNSSSASSTNVFTSVRNKAENHILYLVVLI